MFRVEREVGLRGVVLQGSVHISSASSTQHFNAFSVAGSTVCNSLPRSDHLRNSAVDSEQFRRELKTYLFARHSKR